LKIVFLVERPTQFDAPFFRFAARDPEHEFLVVFTSPDIEAPVFDPELGRSISWGIELFGGYPHELPSGDPSRWLKERLLPQRWDLLITNGYREPLHQLAAKLAKQEGTATALRMDSVYWDRSAMRNLVRRLRYTLHIKRMYDLFLGAGSMTLDYLQAFGVSRERMGLFSYAVDVEEFRNRSNLSPAERTAFRERLGVPPAVQLVLSLTKFIDREAPWDLLRAFGCIGREDLWLVLAGDGDARADLEWFVRERGLNRVRFPGYIPYPELPSLYGASDLFVHPVREELWGVSVQEALACGLPAVVSSHVGAGYDLIESGGNGFVYAVGDDTELAARIEDALALPLEQVRQHSREILARWDYAANWRHLLKAADRVVKRS